MQTRKKPRKVLTVPGRYFTGQGEPVSVRLLDLSVGGCRFAIGETTLPPGSSLQVIIADRGPYKAHVKWCADGECGVTFDVPLDEEDYNSFRNSHVFDFSDEGAPGTFTPIIGDGRQRFC